MVSTPIQPGEQGAWGGNEYEVHRCGWSVQELLDLGARVFIADPVSLIAMY